MANLIWTERALVDLEDVFDYIAKDSPVYARAHIGRLVDAVERLEQFPQSGRKVPESPGSLYREVIVGRYRVIYRHDIKADSVYIVTVVHGSRLLHDEDL